MSLFQVLSMSILFFLFLIIYNWSNNIVWALHYFLDSGISFFFFFNLILQLSSCLWCPFPGIHGLLKFFIAESNIQIICFYFIASILPEQILSLSLTFNPPLSYFSSLLLYSCQVSMCFLCSLAHVEPKQLCQDHVIASWLSPILSDLFILTFMCQSGSWEFQVLSWVSSAGTTGSSGQQTCLLLLHLGF